MTFLCVYKLVVSDEKYCILFVNISTTGCPLSKKKVELFHADRRTDRLKDMTKLIVTFSNLAKAPKNKKKKDQNILIFS